MQKSLTQNQILPILTKAYSNDGIYYAVAPSSNHNISAFLSLVDFSAV